MLRRKMLRDVMRYKAQFISVFLMAFLAVFIYSGVGGEWRGLRQSANEFYEKTNLADATILGGGFSDEQENAVSGIEGVSATERRTVIEAMVRSSSNGDFAKEPVLSLSFVEKNEISALYLTEGWNLT